MFTVKSLAKGTPHESSGIKSVEYISGKSKIDWEQTADGLVIRTQGGKPCEAAYVFRIRFAKDRNHSQSAFPFHPPKERPKMELSQALDRYYDAYNGQRPEINELYSQFRYTELEGFDYHGHNGTRVRRDPSKVIRANRKYYVWYTHCHSERPSTGVNNAEYGRRITSGLSFVGSGNRTVTRKALNLNLMKNFPPISILLLSVLYWATEPAAAEPRPNVLFIAIDDLNTCPDGLNGETSVATPNISKLANRGVLFTNAHCAAPACSPSRAAVISGLAPSTTGVYLNSQDWRENKILKDHTTLPHQFQNNGYTTMGGGKIYHAASLSQKGYTGFMDSRPWDEYFPSKERQMPQEVLPEKVPTNTDKAFYGGRFDWAELDNQVEDPKNFTNLLARRSPEGEGGASNPEHAAVMRKLASGLPKIDADGDPAGTPLQDRRDRKMKRTN